ILSPHERNVVLHSGVGTTSDSQRARLTLVVEFKMEHIARHCNPDQMPNLGNFLSGPDSGSLCNVRFALDLSVTSEKRSVINLECKSFAVKCIRAARDHAIGNGMDWCAHRKIQITASMQPCTARARGSERQRRFFPTVVRNDRKREEELLRSLWNTCFFSRCLRGGLQRGPCLTANFNDSVRSSRESALKGFDCLY